MITPRKIDNGTANQLAEVYTYLLNHMNPEHRATPEGQNLLSGCVREIAKELAWTEQDTQEWYEQKRHDDKRF